MVHDSGTGGHLLKRSQAESEACSEFAASMILSDDAKMFSIAREFWRAKYTPFYLHSAITAFFIFFNYRVARLMNRKLDLFKRPPLVRGLGYLAILPWVFLTFLLVKVIRREKIPDSQLIDGDGNLYDFVLFAVL